MATSNLFLFLLNLLQEFVYTGVWCVFYFVASLTILTNGGVYAAAGVSCCLLCMLFTDDLSGLESTFESTLLFLVF